MRASRTLPLVAGLAWCLLSSDVQAAPPGPGIEPLHVLEFYTDDADDQAKALTLALRSRVRASPGNSLAEGDFALGVFLASLNCGEIPDLACQSRIGDSLKIDQYIWGILHKAANGQVTVDIHLWRRGQQEVRQQTSISQSLTVAEDPGLQKVADQLLNKLVNFGKIGTVRLANPESLEGDLYIDGQPQGHFSGAIVERTLPIGTHQFEVRRDGQVLAQGSGQVGPNNPLDLDLHTPETNKVVAPVEPIEWKKPASYAALGVGGAMVLGAAYMTLWSATDGFGNDSLKKVGESTVKGQKICDVAREPNGAFPAGKQPDGAILADAVKTCDRGDSFQTWQSVLYPMGGLLIAGGIYLYSTSKQGAKTDAQAATKQRIEITPFVGKDAGFLNLKATFLLASYRSRQARWSTLGHPS